MSKDLKAILNNLKKEALKDCDFTPYTIEELNIKVYREKVNNKIIKDCKILEKSLKALEIISQNFRLVGNCLHAKNPYAKDGWVFVKEIEDEEELEAWKEVLL